MKRIADFDPDQMIPPQRAVYDEIVSGPRKGVCGPLSVSPIELDDHFCQADFRDLIVRLDVTKGCHKALDLASRRRFAGFEVALNAQPGERS